MTENDGPEIAKPQRAAENDAKENHRVPNEPIPSTQYLEPSIH